LVFGFYEYNIHFLFVATVFGPSMIAVTFGKNRMKKGGVLWEMSPFAGDATPIPLLFFIEFLEV
jgi:hypothetical protein